MTIEIVPYTSKYRDVVRRCVYETGHGGESIAPYFTSLDLFADMLTLYYTDYEPEHAIIPLVDGEPAGYLLGCADSANCDKITRVEIYPRILRGLMRGRYDVDRITARYLYRGLLDLMLGALGSPPIEQYPAHLHIDLFAPYRRFGLGTRLISDWCDTLRRLRVPGVHLGTSTAHTTALPFYTKLGFRRYSVRRVYFPYFTDREHKDMYSVCYVMGLKIEE